MRELLEDPNCVAIAQTIIVLGQTMKLLVIAEGVETNEQRDFLIERGCLNFQGYLFSRPVSLEKFEQLVDQNPDPDTLNNFFIEHLPAINQIVADALLTFRNTYLG